MDDQPSAGLQAAMLSAATPLAKSKLPPTKRTGPVPISQTPSACTVPGTAKRDARTPPPRDVHPCPSHAATDQLVAAPIVIQLPPATSTSGPGPVPSAS